MGGSGGGASGAVSYPAYMVTFHSNILDHSGTDNPEASFIDAFNIAYGGSPFAGALAYDPEPELTSASSGVTTFQNAVIGLDFIGDFNNALATSRVNFPLGTTPLETAPIVPPAAPYAPPASPVTVPIGEINADVAALNALLTAQMNEEDLPRFRAGMLNINAIHSSAFIIGEAIIIASKNRTLAKYATELQIKLNEQVREINSRDAIVTKEILSKHQELYREDVLRLQLSQMELNARHKMSKHEIDAKFYIHREELVRIASVNMLADLMKKVDLFYQAAHINAEVRRMHIVANKEEVEEQLAIDESDAKWDIDLFRLAGVILAAPSGGVAQGTEKKSKINSAIGGALSGAATGAVVGAGFGGVGAPVGAAIGAVAGVGLALL